MSAREESIKRVAYQIYKMRERCKLPGNEKQDWFDALKVQESYERLEEALNDQRRI